MTTQEAIKTIIQQNNKLTELINDVINNIGNEYDDTEIRKLINNNKDRLNAFMNGYSIAYLNNNNLGAIKEVITADPSIDDSYTVSNIRDSLRILGNNYRSLYQIAKTLKTFIESTDTADTTINTWREIENFLAGIEDSDSLLSIINNLSQEITDLQNNVIAELSQINTELDTPITRDKIDKDNTGLFKQYDTSAMKNITEVGSYIVNAYNPNAKPGILLVSKKTDGCIGQTLLSIHDRSFTDGTYFDIRTREYDITTNLWSSFQYSTMDSNLIGTNSISKDKLSNDIVVLSYNIVINISDTTITSIKINNRTKTVDELKTIMSNINLDNYVTKITVKIGNINIPVKTFDLSGYIIAESIDFDTLNRSVYLVDIVNDTVTKKEINYLS